MLHGVPWASLLLLVVAAAQPAEVSKCASQCMCVKDPQYCCSSDTWDKRCTSDSQQLCEEECPDSTPTEVAPAWQPADLSLCAFDCICKEYPNNCCLEETWVYQCSNAAVAKCTECPIWTSSPTPPTKQPTTESPTTDQPTRRPTGRPSRNPTTDRPTRLPTEKPTRNPTTQRPSRNPTTDRPTNLPTSKPTPTPTLKPTPFPTPFPTSAIPDAPTTFAPTPIDGTPPWLPIGVDSCRFECQCRIDKAYCCKEETWDALCTRQANSLCEPSCAPPTSQAPSHSPTTSQPTSSPTASPPSVATTPPPSPPPKRQGCSLSADLVHYDGTVNRSVSGTECQVWAENIPHATFHLPSTEHNFCRNPDNDPEGPWCYTTDALLRWEYCHVGTTDSPRCESPGSEVNEVPATCLAPGQSLAARAADISSSAPSGQCMDGPNSAVWPPHANMTQCQAECACGQDPKYCCQNSCKKFDNQCLRTTDNAVCRIACSTLDGNTTKPPEKVVTPVTVTPANETDDLINRVIGGVDATPRAFPFIVSIQTAAGFHFCGGSLISPEWVLTAAHCILPEARLVRIGMHSKTTMLEDECAETFTIKRLVVHESYLQAFLGHDIALIQLSGKSSYPPIALSSGYGEMAETDLTVAGWGQLYQDGPTADTLQQVQLQAKSRMSCQMQFTSTLIRNGMMCAGSDVAISDSCQGDSGGPLFVKTPDGHDLLVGAVSFGKGCGQFGQYAVYTKVSAYTQWVCQNSGVGCASARTMVDINRAAPREAPRWLDSDIDLCLFDCACKKDKKYCCSEAKWDAKCSRDARKNKCGCP